MMNEDLLKELFEYDGFNLLWKVKKADRTKIGSIAGWIEKGSNMGYRRIEINGKKYPAHRLILMWHGIKVPKELDVDHINHDRADNRIENLRLVTRLENMRNKKLYKNNKSGQHGIEVLENGYKVTIGVEGETVYLGRYETINQALEAREQALSEHGFHENHNIKRI